MAKKKAPKKRNRLDYMQFAQGMGALLIKRANDLVDQTKKASKRSKSKRGKSKRK